MACLTSVYHVSNNPLFGAKVVRHAFMKPREQMNGHVYHVRVYHLQKVDDRHVVRQLKPAENRRFPALVYYLFSIIQKRKIRKMERASQGIRVRARMIDKSFPGADPHHHPKEL